MAGLRVGQAYEVFYRPGFGLAVPAPKSLSTQPPFATQALNMVKCHLTKLKTRSKFAQLLLVWHGMAWRGVGANVCWHFLGLASGILVF